MTKRQKVKFIKDALIVLSFSQEELAAAIGVARPRVTEWVSGRVEVRDWFILAVECVLRRELHWGRMETQGYRFYDGKLHKTAAVKT